MRKQRKVSVRMRFTYSFQDKGDSANPGTQIYPKRYCQQRKAISVLACIFFNANFSHLSSLLLLISYLF